VHLRIVFFQTVSTRPPSINAGEIRGTRSLA
jgi:hypothetical protein